MREKLHEGVRDHVREVNMSVVEVEILSKAKQNILDHGWCQQRFESNKGEFCLEGSLTSLTISKKYHFGDVLAAKELLKTVTESENLALWNDKTERTKQEVLDVLDQAISRSKEMNEF